MADEDATRNAIVAELEGSYYTDATPNQGEQVKIDRLMRNIEAIDKRVLQDTPHLEKTYRIDYQKELNEEQLRAVLFTEKPLLVIAGAGTGKTRVIVYKVAYLIEKGVPPNSILLLSFTRKAANEMVNRVYNLLHQSRQANTVFGGTFHSFAARMLRIYGNLIGLPSFTILDQGDMRDVLSLVRRETGLGEQRRNLLFPKNKILQTIISRSKNLQLPLEKVMTDYLAEDIVLEYQDDIVRLAGEVEAYKRKHNLLDYDDLLIVLCQRLELNSAFLQRVRQRFSYVLVDEYQDTNGIQRKIVELVVGDRSCLTVVGDDAQSIYGFRGANYENILCFQDSFSDSVAVKIEENYRSNQGVLDFTNQVILSNRLVFRKTLHSQQGKVHTKPVLCQASDQRQEAEYIVGKIIDIRKNNSALSYADFAVLVRSSFHSIFIQAEFTKYGLPFVLVGGVRFQEKRHIKDVVAFLKVIDNQRDTIAWYRIFSLLEGVGGVRANTITQYVMEQDVVDFQRFQSQKFYPQLRVYQQFFDFARTEKDPATLVKKILAFYEGMLAGLESDWEQRVLDFDPLVELAGEYNSVNRFLSDFLLEPPNAALQGESVALTHKDVIVISTIHSAKGLEWDTVFIPALVEGMFPSRLGTGTFEDVEEERRVFYVAASRAKERLFLLFPSYVKMRDNEFAVPSRFLGELPDKDVFHIDEILGR